MLIKSSHSPISLALAVMVAASACSNQNGDRVAPSVVAQPQSDQVAASSLLEPADARLVVLQYWKQQGSMGVQDIAEFAVSVTNNSSRELSPSSANAVYATYYWLGSDGAPLKWDNPRTPISSVIEPGGAGVAIIKVAAPEDAGEYILEIALGQEGGLAFREHGQAPLRYKVEVAP